MTLAHSTARQSWPSLSDQFFFSGPDCRGLRVGVIGEIQVAHVRGYGRRASHQSGCEREERERQRGAVAARNCAEIARQNVSKRERASPLAGEEI